jgi:hypothetical protein
VELIHYAGAMFLMTLIVTCVGGLYDLHRNGESMTWAGVRKAIMISLAVPLALLVFGAVSWAISFGYMGVLQVAYGFASRTNVPFLLVLCLPFIMLVVINVARRRRGRSSL